jgi:serine/threonine protein kinase
VPVEERFAWARTTCESEPEVYRELVSLLENDRDAARGAVEGKVKSAMVSMFDPPAGDAQRRVGPYKLERELGRGGMGTVYLAERDDQQYQTKVAIKLVRPGMDTEIILHRFRRERQILAQLQHPHIARLLDGGTTGDDRPYIVMEYIDGMPITQYSKAHALGTIDRLRLFLDVCSAVEYAHHHFVVHRDIKPGNILVSGSGTAKLLDFGICKLLQTELRDAETASGTLHMLTPEYASPEQVRGDPVTIASDIYSLAAVLYELLTGAKPHRIEKLTPQAMELAICEQDVLRPSLAGDRSHARRLKGDLDNILMHALQKDPDRRYASVEQLSDDIRRYLSHQPVRARPDTLAYRVGKFARRQRSPLAATGLAAAILVTGAVVSSRQAREARVQSNIVKSELAAALQQLALIDAGNGKRDSALALARRAFELSDASRGAGTMGLVFAALARAGRSADDRRQASEWLQKSLDASPKSQWKAPEMQQVEAAAAEMNKPW